MIKVLQAGIMARQELATNTTELTEVGIPEKRAKNIEIQALLDDLKKLKKPSPEGQKAFEEGRKAFRDSFSL